MENSLETVGEHDLHYHRQRQRNRVFQKLVAFIAAESERLGFSKKDVALALGRDPSQITRWLSQPTNLTLDTISDLLTALKAEMDVTIVGFEDRAQPNFSHQLLLLMQNHSSKPQTKQTANYDQRTMAARAAAKVTGAERNTAIEIKYAE